MRRRFNDQNIQIGRQIVPVAPCVDGARRRSCDLRERTHSAEVFDEVCNGNHARK